MMATHKNKELEAPNEVGAPREMEAPKREVKALREVKDPHMIGQTIIHIWPIKEEKNRQETTKEDMMSKVLDFRQTPTHSETHKALE